MTAAADLHTLTGAYAAHALDGPEQDAFEQHLAQCDACAQEVREFTATLARLGSAEAVTPPPELKHQVMVGIQSVRQLAPRASGSSGDAADDASADRRLSRARRWPRYALAACLALAVTLGGLALQQHDEARRANHQVAQLQDQQARFSSLLTAADARTATGAAGSGIGTVVWSKSRGQAGFLAAGLPALPQGRTYELWFNDSGTMRPAGLLASPDGSLLLSGPLDGAIGIGVTVEPAGGSAKPSGNPVMLLSFT